jgi:RNA ligase (TIGR02306 family)
MIIDDKRALAYIRVIEEIKPIEGADAIEAARLGGWWVVVKKGAHTVGEEVVYFEIDSWVPTTVAPFLSKGKTPRVYNGVQGERLRTVRLRGQLSQGLVIAKNELGVELFSAGDDLTGYFDVQKWEAPQPKCNTAKGNFPEFLRKTDQERIQNMPEVFDDPDMLYEVTIKLDGSSVTIYVKDGYPGVCSRTLERKLNSDDHFVVAARNQGLIDGVLNYCADVGRNLAFQGELVGPGIQGNKWGLVNREIQLFSVWDIDAQCHLRPQEASAMVQRLEDYAEHAVLVPRWEEALPLNEWGMDDLIEFVNDNNYTYPWPVEGLVFKALDGSRSFKVINNEYLEKNQ